MKQREHKYRAWDKEEKRFYYFKDIADLINGKLWSHSDNSQYIRRLKWQEYTGLKDKNGKEIYEGDILICDHTSNREVFFADASYFTRNIYMGKKSVHFLTDDPEYYEVIGNIYENPIVNEKITIKKKTNNKKLIVAWSGTAKQLLRILKLKKNKKKYE